MLKTRLCELLGLGASEHQRQFERIVATWPSCSRGVDRVVVHVVA
jgi:hypothetical protein